MRVFPISGSRTCRACCPISKRCTPTFTPIRNCRRRRRARPSLPPPICALPVAEATGLPYASKVTAKDKDGHTVPVMHACGHDMHVTWLVGATTVLAQARDSWKGTVMAVFQPAEETGTGAQAMIDDGLFQRFPKPDIVLGQHVMVGVAGTVSGLAGVITSAGDSLQIRLFGRGAHGSMPQASIDPVVMAASVVLRLQTIVSRELAATEAAVVTIGALQAGT